MAVRIETQGAVATVVIDRPERKNAVDAQTARDLAEAFRAVEANGEIGAAVLWGAGGTFCAGADLKAIGSEGSRIRPTGDSGESFEGAARFAGGAGRHGAPAS
jgi:enoyl-CoA hydratase